MHKAPQYSDYQRKQVESTDTSPRPQRSTEGNSKYHDYSRKLGDEMMRRHGYDNQS